MRKLAARHEDACPLEAFSRIAVRAGIAQGDQRVGMGLDFLHIHPDRALESSETTVKRGHGGLQKPLGARQQGIGTRAVGMHLDPAFDAPGIGNAAHFNGIGRQITRSQGKGHGWRRG